MFLAAVGHSAGAAGTSAPSPPPNDEAPCAMPPPWAHLVSDLPDDGIDHDEPTGANESRGAADGAADEREAKRPRAACGSEEDRWELRCTIACIQIDQAKGCTDACGCVRRLSLDEILKQRKARKTENSDGRRAFLRSYFEGNPRPNSKIGFKLHTEDDGDRLLCVTGFIVYHGFTSAYFYHHRERFLNGDRADDAHGGRRCAGAASGDTFEDDSPEFMAFYAWFKELREDTECMPNTRLRQIDYIEHKELFSECLEDLVRA